MPKSKPKKDDIIHNHIVSDDEISFTLNSFKLSFKKEYIMPVINKMIYIIQNNINNELITILNFENPQLIEIAKMHNEFDFIKFLQDNINPYIGLFNILLFKDMKLFCLHQIIDICNKNM